MVLNQTTMAQDIAFDVVEGQSVMFVCEMFATLGTRQPGGSDFLVRPVPPRVISLGELTPNLFTFEFQNVSRTDNGTAFRCGTSGGGMTDVGVIIVLCKL